jgi:glyoxylase-like metal-dependent hydrolase (beta-lactamase superfamily II)
MRNQNTRMILQRSAIAFIILASIVAFSTLVETSAQDNERPTYVPVPESALGPDIPSEGYLVQELGENLYMITDGLYQMMFLVTSEGVVAVDAPATLANYILPAIASVTDKPVTHVVYSHAHADHVAGMSIYPLDAVYIAQEEAVPLILRANNPVLPPPTITFAGTYTLELGGEVLQLDYHGNNHQPGEIFIYAPKQRVLMHIDLIFPGWAPFKNLAIAQDIPGFIEAFDETLSYDFEYLVAGHLGRPGTRADVELQREYIFDLLEAAQTANSSVNYVESIQGVDPQNVWAQFDAYADAVTQRCVELMPARYLTLLGGADVFLEDNCFIMTESLRIDMVLP